MTRRVPIIAIAVALLLTAACWFLLYQPLDEEEARYRDETAQLEARAAQLQAQVASLREVQDNAEVYRSQLVRLEEYIPGQPEQPEALRELQRIADQSGVEITEMSYADPEVVPAAPETGDPDRVLAAIPTQMVVEGGYFQVVDLLRRVEVDLNRAVKVDTVSMAEAEEEFPQIAVTWTGQIFALLPSAEIVGEDGQAIEPQQPTDSATTAPDGEAATEGATEGPPADGAPADGAPADDTEAGIS